ncbi:hypothetical protein AL515_03515 [Citrobacter sp. FDAARGOS_156]|uniref:hypothetical protein n=1 Tax=Citrobacter sp. FDAARGOS_156 TaxID=1702170 RepID=UPI00076AE9A9|nr:hypothetical protein [Citrobacter sp. FDAARGOS_156]AMH12970.1 hypothetical protein AL515_03515 [Citrobacter sp. FDAARGOS_156]
MIKNIKWFAPLLFIGAINTVNAGDLFTCKLPGNKAASVSVDGAQIYYSYDKTGTQPDVQLDRTHTWFMGNQHYAGANYQLTFRVQKGNYNYVLYSQNYGNGLDEGLVAYNGSKILFNKKCIEAAKVDDSVWNAQPTDFGMQDETDQTSDFVGKLDLNGNTPVPDAGNNSASQTKTDEPYDPGTQPSDSVISGSTVMGTKYTYNRVTKIVTVPSITTFPWNTNLNTLAKEKSYNFQQSLELRNVVQSIRDKLNEEQRNAAAAKAAADAQAARDAVPQVPPPADGSAPVKIDTDIDSNNMLIVKVFSTVDSVAVLDVKVNRGNCSAYPQKIMKINFGDYQNYSFIGCRPMEVQVDTNMGSWTFK